MAIQKTVTSVITIIILSAIAGYFFFVEDSIINPESSISPTPVALNCVVTGCSGQICSDRDVPTTCEFREEYSCYKTARCERQSNGQCGWTVTAALTTCLNSK